MQILIACEESQTVCCEMRRLGHEAYSCDIQECSGGHPEWHVCGDVLPLINGRCEFTTMDGVRHEIPGRWDMIIAHPPCTYLSVAGAARLYPKKGQLDEARYRKGLEAKEFFMKFINADCDKIAVENPVQCRVFEMPPYSQEIQPYQFGHPYSKKTRLWLKGLPPLQPTQIIKDNIISWVSGGGERQPRKREKAIRDEIPRRTNSLQNIPRNSPCNGRTVGWRRKKTAAERQFSKRQKKIVYSGILPQRKEIVKYDIRQFIRRHRWFSTGGAVLRNRAAVGFGNRAVLH